MNQEDKKNSSEENPIPQEELITEPQAEEQTAEAPSEAALSSEGELQAYKDKYMRLYSEFENFRRRTSKERLEQAKTAGEDVVKSILPVLDDLERASLSMSNTKEVDALREGVELVIHKFKQILAQKGLEEMQTLQQAFDPEFHEAIAQMPAPSAEMEDKIVDQVEKGYFFNGKVIRYAKVVVGKKQS